MDTSDRLIEYYFQRKIKGMADGEIQKSLTDQFMEDEEREAIFKEVLRKEAIYLKSLTRKRLARIIMISGFALLLIAVIILLVAYYKPGQSLSMPLFYLLAGLGIITFISGLIIGRA